jgi:hypothetical protein
MSSAERRENKPVGRSADRCASSIAPASAPKDTVGRTGHCARIGRHGLRQQAWGALFGFVRKVYGGERTRRATRLRLRLRSRRQLSACSLRVARRLGWRGDLGCAPRNTGRVSANRPAKRAGRNKSLLDLGDFPVRNYSKHLTEYLMWPRNFDQESLRQTIRMFRIEHDPFLLLIGKCHILQKRADGRHSSHRRIAG